MSAPGAMAGRKLAALRMPSDVAAGVGRAMVKVRALDGPPSLSTVTVAVPLAAMRAAGTAAVNWEALTNLVTSGAPFHCTVEVAENPEPARVRVKAVPPGAAELGLRLARDAAGVDEMESGSWLEETGPSLTTVILAVPVAAIKAADTSAVNCEALM